MIDPSAKLRISVALCTHNGAMYVREQLESILRQEYPATEIALSDDASTDDTVSIVEDVVGQWSAPRPALRVIRNSSALGVVANFEQAAAACTGDLIALCDQDDVWHPDKLARFAAAFASSAGLPLAHSDAALVTESRELRPHSLLASLEATARERRELVDGRSYRALIRRNLVTGATAVFRSSLLEWARPFPPEWIHDEWLAIVAAASSSTLLIDAELIDYRQHGANQIGASKPSLRDKVRKFREPRQERNEHLVARARSLVARLEALGPVIEPERLDFARRKLAHDKFRLALPRTRLFRIPAITGAVLGGRYRLFSRGTLDALRDLAQPAT